MGQHNAEILKRLKKLEKCLPCCGGGESCCYYEVTLEEALSLISEQSLVKGATYKILGVHKNKVDVTVPVLYDDGTNSGTNIYLTALTSSELSTEGWGEFYNPKYDKNNYGDVVDGGNYMYNIWDGDNPDAGLVPTYIANQKVIWGGYVWNNVSGNVGSAVSYTELDNVEWEKVAYNTTDYNKVIDYIEYDITNDWISRRRSGEKVVDITFPYQYWNSAENIYGVTLHGISVVQWGNHYDLTTQLGTGLVIAEDSYIETANFKGKLLLGFNATSYSVVKDNYRGLNSEFRDILLDGRSYQMNCRFESGAKQSNIIITNLSYQYQIYILNNGSQSYISFLNNSYQSGGGDRDSFIDNSSQDHCVYNNGSYCSDLQMTDSNANNFSFINGSYEGASTYVNGALANYISVANQGVITIDLDGTSRSSYSFQSCLWSSIGSITGLSNTGGVVNGKEIEYDIIGIDFNGTAGKGAVGSIDIPILPLTQEGFCIHEVIVYSSGLVGGVGSYITLGIETDDVDCGLSAVTGLVTTLAASPVIKYTNLPMTLSAANGRNIVMAVGANDITAGRVNIKVKATSFFL